MIIEAMKQALFVIHNQGDVGVDELIAVEKALHQAIAEAEKQCTHRLVDVTNPVVKSGYMCMDCGALFGAYIQKPDAKKQEPVALVVATAPKRIWLDLGFDPSEENEISFRDLVDATWSDDNATGHGIEYVRADTSPPQCQPLYPREVKDVLRATGYVTNSQAWELAEEVMKLLAAHGIKGEA